jgi:hypothetical protein
VEAFAVHASGGRPVLARAGRAKGEAAALARRGEGLAVVSAGGHEIPVKPGAADGYIDSITNNGG